MKRRPVVAFVVGLRVASGGAALGIRWLLGDHEDRGHFDRDEMQVEISKPRGQAGLRLMRAGEGMADAKEIPLPADRRLWLAKGRYVLEARTGNQTTYLPMPVAGYRLGPDPEGGLRVTIRPTPGGAPPRLAGRSPQFVLVPSGHFVIGDRANPREAHYVWVTSFYIAEFEVMNDEFARFRSDRAGWNDDSNWTGEGRLWRASHRSQASDTLKAGDTEYARFGRPDQPATSVTWFEANAYCRWMTRKLGAGRWIYSLPSDAEWEKAARGPDGFDYGLGMKISDADTPLYNWRKNPEVTVTVVSLAETRTAFRPNRYGLYHMSGNVAEWTQSAFLPYGRENPYSEEGRNGDNLSDRRTARGGSWYSATVAPLYIPYRDGFSPEHANNDLGFRIIAKLP